MKFSKLVLKNTNIFLNRNLNYDFYVKKYIHTSFSLKNTFDDEFRVIDLKNKHKNQFPERRKSFRPEINPPREKSMPVDQDWPSVWPGPKTFHPASVPLPIRQGYNDKGPPPDKYANAELMKIPNFLHLTPPAIKRHCEALKKFCTPWPSALTNDEECQKHFPIEVITSDYCHSAPTIRNPLARIVTLKVKVDSLNFDTHAKDKLLRLVGERYNPEDDILTIVTDRCPLRKQNYDYAMYLLTALYHESWKVESWESEKSIEDMEYYDWNLNVSKKSFDFLKDWLKNKCNIPEDQLPNQENYQKAVENIMNQG